jgi:regulator of protease activity HflC (stomatin/prohibitin superfamily)
VANVPNGFDDDAEPAPLGAAASLPAGPETHTKRKSDDDGGGKRRRFPFRLSVFLIIIAVVLLAFVPAFASGLKKTPRDRVGISYGGGPIEGSHFQRIIQPGHGLFFNGFLDPLYLYPSDQQAYIVSKTPGQGSVAGKDSIIAPSKDRVQVEYQVAAYFKLNTNKLRKFHEQFGLRYNAYTSAGWKNLLQNTFRQQLENAIQEETRRFDVADIYGDESKLKELQGDIQASLSDRLRAALGDEYFCGPTFTAGGKCDDIIFVIKKVDLPQSVVQAFNLQRSAAINVVTEEQNTARRAIEAQGIRDLAAAGVNGEDYVLLKAIEAGKTAFWVLPSDSGGFALQTPALPGTGNSGSSSPPSTGAPTTTTTTPRSGK